MKKQLFSIILFSLFIFTTIGVTGCDTAITGPQNQDNPTKEETNPNNPNSDDSNPDKPNQGKPDSEKKLSSIFINQQPYKLSYEKDDVLDLSGLIVKARYSDGSESVIDGWSSSPAEGRLLTEIGDNNIIITYQGKTASFTVNVVEKNVNAVIANSYFWGTWVRMDNGSEYEILETTVNHNGDSNTITDSTEGDKPTLSVEGIGTFTKQSDSEPSTIVKKLFLAGEIVTVNTEISFEKAEEIAMEYDILCEKEEKVDVIEELLKEEDENEEKLVERPPVICVMGHVDHGKTSLLDAIRNTHVIDKEAGGITQHIGAYQVKINDKNITFLDTPGHEAFTAMRMRGATSTDIAVLVVAADDGVMPQTVEAISHAKAAGVPIIVAVNKVDKIGYDFDDKTKDMTSYPQISQLMTELATDHQLNPEAWGGDTIFVPVSAKKGLGIDNLLENILISAEILELKSNPDRKARGLVIEAKLEKGRGPVATVLVQKGTLKVGDFISAGEAHGKVRAMINDKKENVKIATPSTPVEILGLNQAPSAGDVFIAHENDKEAKHFADTFIAEHKIKKIEDTKSKMTLDDVYTKIKEDNLKSLNIIVKADVQGSVEAVKQSLEKISNEEVVVKVIHGGVGAINESDVTLASASAAIIIGFNVRIDNQAKDTAEREGVDVRLYSVIYQAIDDVEAAMKGLLDPIFEEKVIGHCEVRQIFKANAIGNIAGSYVLDGLVKRGCSVRISREGEQIFEGKLASLKRFKDDVKEVKAGYECGLVFEGFNGIQELDIVEAYEMVEVPR